MRQTDARDQKRVLVVSPTVPAYDQESGSRRVFHVLEFLREAGHAVTFIADYVAPGEDRYLAELRQMGIATYAGDLTQWAGDHFLESPSSLATFGRFDVAILHWWHCAERFLPLLRRHSPDTRVVVDSVDCHFLRTLRARLAAKQADGTKVLSTGDIEAMAKELATYAGADAVWTVSDDETDFLQRMLGPAALVETLPDTETLSPSTVPFESRNGVLFVGNFQHPPNVEALHCLVRDIIPRIDPALLARHPVSVVGNKLTDDLIAQNGGVQEHVKWVGWVPSVLPYIERARVSAVPLLHGAGTKRKVVQALMIGTPTVCTSIGAEGLELAGGNHVLVSDDPPTFARSIERLLTDEALWRQMAAAGRDHALSIHDGEQVRRRFHAVLDATMARSRSVAAVDAAWSTAPVSPRAPTPSERTLLDLDVRAFAPRSADDPIADVTITPGDTEVVSKPELAKGSLPGPRQVSIELTTACNYECRHCATTIPGFKQKTMKREMAWQVLEQIQAFDTPPAHVRLFGQGEVCVIPWMPQYVTAIRRALPDTTINISSNGSRLKTLSANFVANRVGTLFLSVEGGSREIHDALRGPGAFDELCEGLSELKRQKALVDHPFPYLCFTSVLTRDSIFDLENLVDFARQYGARTVQTQALIPHPALDLLSLRVSTLSTADKARAVDSVDRAERKASAYGIQFNHLSGGPFHEPEPDWNEVGNRELPDGTREPAGPPMAALANDGTRRYKKCVEPWSEAWINVHLGLNTCERRRFDVKEFVDQIPLREIWYSSDGLNRVRENLLGGTLDPICAGCVLRDGADSPPEVPRDFPRPTAIGSRKSLRSLPLV